MRRRVVDETKWHLDRRVPISLILAIAIQTGSILWWAASVSARLDNLEQKTAVVGPQSDRLTRVEVQLEVVKEGVNEIKRLLQPKSPQ